MTFLSSLGSMGGFGRDHPRHTLKQTAYPIGRSSEVFVSQGLTKSTWRSSHRLCRETTHAIRTLCRDDTGSAGDFFRQEALRRRGILFDGNRPALVLLSQLRQRNAALAGDDCSDEVHPAVARRALQ
jgi:hypothetical protein